jgi:hypothetical protein
MVMPPINVPEECHRQLCGLMCAVFVVSAPVVSYADRDYCRVALTSATQSSTNLEICNLAQTDRGEVLGYLSRDALYLAYKDRIGTHLVEINLTTYVMRDAPTNQPLVEEPFSPGSWPDAKQLYFPFDFSNRIRDEVGQPGTGFVCIDPKSAHLTRQALTAAICKQGPKK